jgi:outer membrane protein
MRVQSLVATLCSLLVLSPNGWSQQPQAPVPPNVPTTSTPGERSMPAAPAGTFSFNRAGGWVTRPYRRPDIPVINLKNSNRGEELIRAGKIYLSLQDAIALALENNLDVELARYGPRLAEAALLRSKAGGAALRGVDTTVTQGSQSAQNAVTGGFGGVGGAASTPGTGGGGGTAGSPSTQSGSVFQVTGATIPTLDPTVSFGLSQSKSSQPQSNPLVTGTSALITENFGMNSGIQQQFLTGTGYQFNWQQNHISTNSPNNVLTPFYNGNFNFQLSQRMLQGFGLGVNNRNIRISKNNLRVSDIAFKLQVIETTRATINLYLDLVSFNETVKVRQKAVELAQKLYDDNKKQVEIGTLAPIEVVRAEAQLAQAQTDLIVADTQVLNQETIIKNVLSRTGIDSPTWESARIIPTDTLPAPTSEQPAPMEQLFNAALEKRPEVEQVRLQITNTKIGLNGARSQLLPSLDAFVTLTNNGLSGIQNPLAPIAANPYFVGGAGNFYEQLLRRNFPSYSAGFQLNVPLRNRAAQADITNDTLNLRRQELQEQRLLNAIKVDVAQSVTNLIQARAGWESAVKARRLQEQTLDAEQKKFALGSSTIFVVVQTQRDLTQAQANEVSAITAFNRAKNQLDVSLGRILEVNSIEIGEAMKGEISRKPTPVPNQ